MYRTGKLDVTSDVRSKPLEKKRKRGRPGKLPLCLTRSPPNRDTSDTTDVVQDEEAFDSEIQLSPVPSATYQPPLAEQHAQSELSPGPSAAPCSPSASSSPQPPAKKRKIARQVGEPRPERLRRSKRTRK